MSTHVSLTALSGRITTLIRSPQSATTLDLGRSTYVFSPDLNGTELTALADLESQALALLDALALAAGWWTTGHVLTATDRKTLGLQAPPPHPDLATHTALGLAGTHAHPYEASGAVATHAGLADPHPGYLTPTEGNAAYAPTHSHPYEASGAVATHAGLSDPHPAYATDANLATHAAGPHGGSPFVRKTADQACSVVALADVADLAVPLAANADVGFEFLVAWQSAATTTGVRFALNGPAGLVELTALVEVQLTATTWQTAVHVAYESGSATASIDAANTRRVARIKGVVRNGATVGSLVLRCGSEVASSAITVKRGSFATYV